MPSLLKSAVRKTLHTIEMPYDAIKHGVKRNARWYKPVTIVAYRGFGNRSQRHLLGRVLEDREIGTATDDDPWWKNSLAMVRRFRTDEVPHCAIEGRMGQETHQVETDSEGYFRIDFHDPIPAGNDQLWYDVELRLLDEVSRGQDEVRGRGEILVPPASAKFGVISDIDDTILKSSANDVFRLATLTFFNNAHTRSPFPHVAAFYQTLQEGADRTAGPNPIFYVSSSAWNIYDLLDDFTKVQQIPRGPILLRDLGIDSTKLLKTGHEHKLQKIEQIFAYYPELPFLLIGDSGQRDPWLYREVVRRYPGRVAAIYIRDVDAPHGDEVEEIVREVSDRGVPMLLMADARDAAEHAAAEGLISQEQYGRVVQSSE